MRRDLVERAVGGVRDAFVTLARDAYPRLSALARLILRDEHNAADAVQEALTAAWLHVRAVRDPGRFDAWLNRLTVHAAYRVARAGRRGVVEIQPAHDDVPDREDAVRVVDDRDQLERGFRRLKPDQRAVLVAHHYLQLDDPEAADLLGIPVGTVKSRLNRATVALRAVLEADARTPGVATEVPA